MCFQQTWFFIFIIPLLLSSVMKAPPHRQRRLLIRQVRQSPSSLANDQCHNEQCRHANNDRNTGPPAIIKILGVKNYRSVFGLLSSLLSSAVVSYSLVLVVAFAVRACGCSFHNLVLLCVCLLLCSFVLAGRVDLCACAFLPFGWTRTERPWSSLFLCLNHLFACPVQVRAGERALLSKCLCVVASGARMATSLD
jgi:hypothetical protein